MEITQVRFEFTPLSTISRVSVNGIPECYILEDTCRQPDPLIWKPEFKINKLTAIPYGRYMIVISLSKRFKKMLPEVLGVPNFEGIRIHPGNKPADTEGCLLPGTTWDRDWVGNSGAAFGPLYRKIEDSLNKGEKVYLEVTK